MSLKVKSQNFVQSAVKRYLIAGISKAVPMADQHRVRLTNSVCLVTTGYLIIFAIIDLYRWSLVEVAMDLVSLILCQIPVLLNFRGRLQFSRVAAVLLFTILCAINAIILGASSQAAWLLSAVTALIGAIFPPREWRTMAVLATLVGSIFVTILVIDLPGIYPLTNEAIMLVKALTGVMMVLVLGAVAFSSNHHATKVIEALEESQLRERQAASEALASSRLATLGELTAGLAHEIVNPLTIIRGNAELIQILDSNKNTGQGKILDKAKTIVATVDRVSALTRGMLAFSRKVEPAEPSCVSVNKVVSESVELFLQFIGESGRRSLDIQLHVPDICPPALGHSGWVQQIMLNLLGNAHQSMVQANNSNKVSIRVEVSVKKNIVAIDVIDIGPGVPEALTDKIMDPFFTTKPVGSGTGLGLSVSRNLAREMAGDLSLYNRCNPTIFRLTLPLSLDENYLAG
jgi:C4-dicarboxylate-specific signal transduction histidine kinase